MKGETHNHETAKEVGRESIKLVFRLKGKQRETSKDAEGDKERCDRVKVIKCQRDPILS